MLEDIDTPKTISPERTRAVFSNEDFKLIRTAIQSYMQEVADQPESKKYSNLYHRLGRLA
ncbi:hypothetical protein [Neorhizobium alkalisoli]|uniref:Uncharacterized protein n=1 Tax=Neorhizobium alkalisoli TaxID=528178 RepID=A0A561R710_9HYPH|nr:hypothetical protein [Neorhizobium alkalisoli]TWF58421.1 hypothetical protein FHW37_101225 [Neorhizobium alkalisoli]